MMISSNKLLSVENCSLKTFPESVIGLPFLCINSTKNWNCSYRSWKTDMSFSKTKRCLSLIEDRKLSPFFITCKNIRECKLLRSPVPANVNLIDWKGQSPPIHMQCFDIQIQALPNDMLNFPYRGLSQQNWNCRALFNNKIFRSASDIGNFKDR